MILTMKGSTSRNHFKENSAHRPQIGFGIIFLPQQYLRSHIQWTSAHCLCQVYPAQMSGESKISNLEHELPVIVFPINRILHCLFRRILLFILPRQSTSQQQILRLNISMNQLSLPQKAQTSRQIPNQSTTQSFVQTTILTSTDQSLQIATGAIFQYQIDAIGSFADFE